MLRRFTTRLPAIAMAGLLTLGLSARARASVGLTLEGAPTQTSATNTVISFAGYSNGTVTSTGAALGEVGLGVPSALALSQTTVTATGPTSATFIFYQNGITSPLGAGSITETLSGHFITGTGTVAFQTWGIDGNQTYTAGGPPPNPPTTPGPPPTASTGVVGLGDSSTGAFTATNPYTLIEVLTIDFTSAGTVTLSSTSSSQFIVPEPSSISLAGLGALGFLAYGWSRHRRDQRQQAAA
jgi:hypothetical protein